MALPALLGGADCGPSNPLQNLSKRFDQDRGIQQDLFGARAGPSREGFRSTNVGPSLHDHNDAARFFNPSKSYKAPDFRSMDSFNLEPLHGALPHQERRMMTPDLGWASEFMQQQPMMEPSTSAQVVNPMSPVQADRVPTPFAARNHVLSPGGAMQWGSMTPTWSGTQLAEPTYKPPPGHDHVSWDKEFDAHQIARPETLEQVVVEPKARTEQQTPQDADELSRTAALLLDVVKDEQNPKFQNSQFLSLMTQLRDRKVVVEGNQLVENNGVLPAAAVDVKGKGKAVEPQFNGRDVMDLIGDHGMYGPLPGEQRQQQSPQEDANDTYFRQENAEYTRFWNEVKATKGIPSSGMRYSWDKLQYDWDRFEATEQGIRPVAHYQFQQNNPYLRREEHVRVRGDERLESVLELEAAVHRDPKNARAWFELGVKQQENEREQKALAALQRANELDPSHLPTWLALAISNTNDGNRIGAYDAVKQWVVRNERHKAAAQEYLQRFPEPRDATIKEKFIFICQCLINMAQTSADDMDPDIQIALGVLFYTDEDYAKAQDCFKAALSVRPDDWLLYNRVGATIANQGVADDALEYYHRALELNPAYIRARYNLGISCINLRRYGEAAHHIFNAILLQDADNVHDDGGMNDARGITSSTLWDSLKTACLHMDRTDLAGFCDRQDLKAFRKGLNTISM
ncbi:TPR-like protein [Marasmius fiardii PR-910]|nr:TPR-like protein [Marasmius fiardii PR-910]